MRDEEFMELIPVDEEEPKEVYTAHPIHKRKSKKQMSDHDAEYWHNAYMDLCQKYEEYQSSMDAYCKGLEATIKSLNGIIKGYEKLTSGKAVDKENSDLDTIADGGTPETERHYFDTGVGLDIRPGREPKLYRLADPGGKGPKRKFDGISLELKHGRGFAIVPRWKDIR